MIDYFIHFINKHFHLFRVDSSPTIKHRSDFMDKLRYIFSIHSRFPGNPLERTLVIRHFFNIHLNFSSQHFRQIRKLLTNQVHMVFLLEIKSSNQFCKFERLVCRLSNNRNGTLPSFCREYHKKQDSNHRQVQSPTERLVRKQITERRLLHLCRRFHISFTTNDREFPICDSKRKI